MRESVCVCVCVIQNPISDLTSLLSLLATHFSTLSLSLSLSLSLLPSPNFPISVALCGVNVRRVFSVYRTAKIGEFFSPSSVHSVET